MSTMGKGRLEAFSDGVLAIIITVMVLEMKVPHGGALADLAPMLPVFLSYVLSFIYVGIYWNNHHHMLQAARGVNATVMWANLHLLFWLSLTPFVTGWMGENRGAWPAALYGVDLSMAGLAYSLLLLSIRRLDPAVGRAVGRDFKGLVSVTFYLVGIGLAFVNVWLAYGCFIIPALLWLVPDRRMERVKSASAG